MAPTYYNFANIRAMFAEGYSNEELLRLCFYVPEFQSFHREWQGVPISTERLILEILDFAHRHLLMDTLLLKAKEANPYRYAEHQPYVNRDLTTAPGAWSPPEKLCEVVPANDLGYGITLGGFYRNLSLCVANKPIAASAQFEKTVLETEKTLDYTGWMNPVRDSGNEGSCVGFSVADALEYQILKTLDQRVVISPRFIYYYARLKGGFSTDEDTGANISDAVSTLSEIGAVAESDWPYVDGEFSTKPPAHLAQAVHYKISKKQSLANSADIKAALIRFGPVVGGIPLYSSANTVDKSGRIPMPGPEDTLMGYTSVSFVGFDDDQGLLKFKNHWKTDWGDNGYGYVSYEFADQFLKDGWAISMEQTE